MYVWTQTFWLSCKLEDGRGVGPALGVPGLDDDLVLGVGLQVEEVEGADKGEAPLAVRHVARCWQKLIINKYTYSSSDA